MGELGKREGSTEMGNVGPYLELSVVPGERKRKVVGRNLELIPVLGEKMSKM